MERPSHVDIYSLIVTSKVLVVPSSSATASLCGPGLNAPEGAFTSKLRFTPGRKYAPRSRCAILSPAAVLIAMSRACAYAVPEFAHETETVSAVTREAPHCSSDWTLGGVMN